MPFYNNGIRTDDARVEPFSSLQAKVDKADGRLLPRAGDWQESVRDGLRSLPAPARYPAAVQHDSRTTTELSACRPTMNSGIVAARTPKQE